MEGHSALDGGESRGGSHLVSAQSTQYLRRSYCKKRQQATKAGKQCELGEAATSGDAPGREERREKARHPLLRWVGLLLRLVELLPIMLGGLRLRSLAALILSSPDFAGHARGCGCNNTSPHFTGHGEGYDCKST